MALRGTYGRLHHGACHGKLATNLNLLAEASDPAIPSIPVILARLVPLLPVSRPGADVLSVLAAEAASEEFSTSRAIGERLRAETTISTRYHAFAFLRLPPARRRVTLITAPFAATVLEELTRSLGCTVAELLRHALPDCHTTMYPASLLQSPADIRSCAPRHDQQTISTCLQGTAVDVQKRTHESPRSVTSARDGIVGPKIVGT